MDELLRKWLADCEEDAVYFAREIEVCERDLMAHRDLRTLRRLALLTAGARMNGSCLRSSRELLETQTPASGDAQADRPCHRTIGLVRDQPARPST